MPSVFRPVVRQAAWIGAFLLVWGAAPARAAGPVPAGALVRAAIAARLGGNADVTVVNLDLPENAPTGFRMARPDPGAWLGQPIRVVLVPEHGPSVVAVVTARVVLDHVVTTRRLTRGATVTVDDIRSVRGEVRGTPMRPLPVASELVGQPVLRPVPAGAVVPPGAVKIRRAVEPGDVVTVLATTGAIEVSASMVAVDGGSPGDLIRVVNPDTHRDLRGRVVKEGLVEVIHAR